MLFKLVILLISLGMERSNYSEISQNNNRNEDLERFNKLCAEFPDYCITQGSKNELKVALTFDDGPTHVTEKVIAILKKYNAKATFFFQGNNLSKHEALVNNIDINHQIGNHSWDHENGINTPPDQLWERQLKLTNNEFERLGINGVECFRPPFGAINQEQLKFLSKKGIKTILWSISTLDWDTERNSTVEIYERFKINLHPGAIVLLHDRTFNDDGSQMLEALDQILEYGIKSGYQFVTVNELIIQ